MNRSGKAAPPLVRFEEVALGYGRAHVLEGLSFAIHEGDFLGIVGPNGAGKSTILKALVGILAPLRGRIVYEKPLHREIRFGYVPQRHALDEVYPLTVFEIVRMARFRETGLLKRPGRAADRVVEKALAQVGISALGRRRYRELSGGQRQRALIARALATGASFLVLDEPTDGMDFASQEAILSLVGRLHEEGRLTVVFVSHLLNEVANHVRRLALLENGRFDHGPVAEIMTGERLSALYRMPVVVERVGRAAVVLPESRR